MWTNLEDLICDTCGLLYACRGERRFTLMGARAAGWHILIEEQHKTGATLCAKCVGTPRSKPAPILPLGEDVGLFELEESSERRTRTSSPDHS